MNSERQWTCVTHLHVNVSAQQLIAGWAGGQPVWQASLAVLLRGLEGIGVWTLAPSSSIIFNEGEDSRVSYYHPKELFVNPDLLLKGRKHFQ